MSLPAYGQSAVGDYRVRESFLRRQREGESNQYAVRSVQWPDEATKRVHPPTDY